MVQGLEEALRRLSPEERWAFREWFVGFDASLWDGQFEDEVTAGRLDKLAEEALQDFSQGRGTEL
jgi:hypothetical protein